MADSDITRYGKKLIKYIWDPLPRNESSSPVVCLGRQYESHPPHATTSTSINATHHIPSSSDSIASRSYEVISNPDAPVEITRCQADAEDSQNHSDQNVSQESQIDEGGWNPAFLDDFESRLWFTYRSGFPPIPKSQDPRAVPNLSFAVRLRNLGNQEGFTSDTGWGCMIRTGQSLLGNALLHSQLQRGKPLVHVSPPPYY